MKKDKVIAGVDGCPGAWVCVVRRVGFKPEPVKVLRTDALTNLAKVVDVLAIDIPIGLPATGHRECDRRARSVLGSPRCSSVFSAPIRPVLNAEDRVVASLIGKAIDGRALTCQTWALVPKIKEVDSWLRSDHLARKKVFEVHPEISFWAWNSGQSMKASKKTAEGRNERETLIRRCMSDWLDSAIAARPPGVFGLDDLFDACAALWTAERVINNEAKHLCGNHHADQYQLPMEITY